MTMTRILTAAFVSAASFGTMSAANAVVPGSDTYVRAGETAAIQSVIEGSAASSGGTAGESQASYGFPVTGGAQTSRSLVPGSGTFDDAADSDAVMSVINGTRDGSFSAVPGSSVRIVPGSDSF